MGFTDLYRPHAGVPSGTMPVTCNVRNPIPAMFQMYLITKTLALCEAPTSLSAPRFDFDRPNDAGTVSLEMVDQDCSFTSHFLARDKIYIDTTFTGPTGLISPVLSGARIPKVSRPFGMFLRFVANKCVGGHCLRDIIVFCARTQRLFDISKRHYSIFHSSSAVSPIPPQTPFNFLLPSYLRLISTIKDGIQEESAPLLPVPCSVLAMELRRHCYRDRVVLRTQFRTRRARYLRISHCKMILQKLQN